MMDRNKCEVTGNICGTDTWPEGQPCLCRNCQEYLLKNIEEIPIEYAKVINDNFWDLI